MTTTYRYAWLAVLDGNGRKRLNEDLLDMDEVNPALTQQNTPGAIWTVSWDNSPTRLATTALSPNIGRDPDIEVVMVSIPGPDASLPRPVRPALGLQRERLTDDGPFHERHREGAGAVEPR